MKKGFPVYETIFKSKISHRIGIVSPGSCIFFKNSFPQHPHITRLLRANKPKLKYFRGGNKLMCGEKVPAIC